MISFLEDGLSLSDLVDVEDDFVDFLSKFLGEDEARFEE